VNRQHGYPGVESPDKPKGEHEVVNADNVPAFVTLSGGSVGFVIARSGNEDCRAAEYEVWTVNLSNFCQDGLLFSIMVP
jgi:hypothetical protein